MLFSLLLTAALMQGPDPKWPQHDRTRPMAKAVEPGTSSTAEAAGKPPADAIVLFDGKDLLKWRSQKDSGPARWKVENGYFEVAKGTGGIETVQPFGDCQLHLEWASPKPPVGEDQDRGNSGVYFMGRYELQVLDSYQSPTYADGAAGAVYGQNPPLVNPVRPPGEWQVYDVVFHGPRFDAAGKLLQPARITAFLNGVLIQDAFELSGPTANKERPPYLPHPAKLPISLQDHGHPVRFRNIWIRELGEGQ